MSNVNKDYFGRKPVLSTWGAGYLKFDEKGYLQFWEFQSVLKHYRSLRDAPNSYVYAPYIPIIESHE